MIVRGPSHAATRALNRQAFLLSLFLPLPWFSCVSGVIGACVFLVRVLTSPCPTVLFLQGHTHWLVRMRVLCGCFFCFLEKCKVLEGRGEGACTERPRLHGTAPV